MRSFLFALFVICVVVLFILFFAVLNSLNSTFGGQSASIYFNEIGIGFFNPNWVGLFVVICFVSSLVAISVLSNNKTPITPLENIVVLMCLLLTLTSIAISVQVVIGANKSNDTLAQAHYQKILDEETNILENQGVLGERELEDIRSYTSKETIASLNGSLSAFFLLFIGSVTGEIDGKLSTKSQWYIQFSWKAKDGWVMTVLPFDLIIFNKDENNKGPTVNFNLKPKQFMVKGVRYQTWLTKDFARPQLFIAPENLEKVVITLSPEEYSASKIPDPIIR